MASETPDMKQLGIMALRCEQAAFENCLDQVNLKAPAKFHVVSVND
jgi:hypothetical protein